tara:strand:- start:135 stop:299 length:165 start_codon:yes stop_codon:yes gene_type:complete
MKKTDQEAYKSALSTVIEGISLANRLNNRTKIIHLNKVKTELLQEIQHEQNSTR